MAQKLIRNIPDEDMAAIEQKAAAANKNAEEYLRDLIARDAASPIVRERYAIKFYNDGDPGRGSIRRFSDHINGVGGGCSDLSEEAGKAYQKAEVLVRRNGPGDREEAIWTLKMCFDNVFEVPV